MNDPRRPERFSPPLPGSGPTEPPGPRTPPADPAYADQAPYASTYGGYTPQWTTDLNEANPTKRLPAYWQQDESPPGGPPPDGLAPPPPDGPRSPRWLWVAAVAAVLLVVALLIALIVANESIKTQTAVPPLPAMPGSSSPYPTPSYRPPTRAPSAPTAAPAPPTISAPTETTNPGATETVDYNVSGEGRAISIMYIDTGDVIQTEFNVALPWSKEVNLAPSPAHPASVTIVNIGHDVTCSVTVAGVQMRQRVGVGLTICDARR
jgi:Mycobacterium membrane protein